MGTIRQHRWGSGAILLLAAGALLASFTARPAQASSDDGRYLASFERSAPPIGWVQFCQQNKSDCLQRGTEGAVIRKGTPEYAAIWTINSAVNEAIAPLTDEDHWGMVERWNYPTDGSGDCEDYVLEKRRRLIEAGISPSALFITVVLDLEGLGHAVLVARTSEGDLVLDNQQSKVKGWSRTGYTYLKWQSELDPGKWVSLGRAGAKMAATP
jgi:predicted transglutaminase-like cysteine proteinase